MTALLLVVLLAAEPSAAAPQAIRLASPGLSGVNIAAEEADFFNDYFSQQLVQKGAGAIRVTTKSEVAALLGFERQKQLLGCSDSASSCLAEISGALGVDGLILGSVGRFGERFGVNLKVVDATNGQLLAGYSDQVSDQQALLGFLSSSARKLANELRQRRGLAPVEEVEQAEPLNAIRLSAFVLTAGYERRVGRALWVGGRLGLPMGSAVGMDAAASLDVSALGRWEPLTGPVGLSLFGGVNLGYLMGMAGPQYDVVGTHGGFSVFAGPELSLFRALRLSLEFRVPLGRGEDQFAHRAPLQLYPQLGWSFLF